MELSTPAVTLEPRKQLRVRLRPDLAVKPQKYEGKTCYVVKDPVSLHYYRFREREYFLMQLLDGRHTLEEARRAFEKRYRPERRTLEEVEGFAQLLITTGLASGGAPESGDGLFERRCRHRRLGRLQRLTDLLYIQIPLCDPDCWLGGMVPWLRWVLSPSSLLAGAAVVLAAMALVATHYPVFQGRLPALHDFFSWHAIGSLWVALALVKVVHEFGHGLSCKACGGEVREMGLLILCLSPCLYCDVTDAWTVPSKWRRVLIGFAGIYVELLIAAVATIIWWGTPADGALNRFCLSLMVVCGVNTVLFNANPLMRFDGYYMLADWLEIPNLRERANRFLKTAVLRTCLGIQTPAEPERARWRRCVFAVYAVASHAYRWVLTCGILWFLNAFLRPCRLGAVGAVLATWAGASLVGWPLYRLVHGLHQHRRLPPMQPHRVLGSAAVVAAFLLFVFLVPLPLGDVHQSALVQLRPDAVENVFVPAAAVLERLYVRDGQRVEENAVLAEFRSLDEENDLEEARSEYEIRMAQVAALREEAARAVDARQRAQVEIALAGASGELDLYARQVRLRDRLLKRLVLRAPRAGVVINPPPHDEMGKLWRPDEGTPFCVIGDPGRVRALVPLPPADYRLLQEEVAAGSPAVTIRVCGRARCEWPGRVACLPEAEAVEIPLALTRRAGGPVPAEPAVSRDAWVPLSQQYLAVVDFPGADGSVYAGTLVDVKVHCRRRTCAWRLWHMLCAVFDLRLV
jgi:putative peptide zinc metalloprotease protein